MSLKGEHIGIWLAFFRARSGSTKILCLGFKDSSPSRSLSRARPRSSRSKWPKICPVSCEYYGRMPVSRRRSCVPLTSANSFNGILG